MSADTEHEASAPGLVIDDYGSPDTDRGRWVTYKTLSLNGGREVAVRFRVRRTPHDVTLRIERRYGREEQVVIDGLKRPQLVRGAEELFALIRDRAAWAWTDAENFWVRPGDSEGAAMWSKLLGEPVAEGQAVDLRGRLTDGVKHHLIVKNVDLAYWILRQTQDLDSEYRAEEEALVKNS